MANKEEITDNDLAENNDDIDDVLGAINQEFTSEPVLFFGHTVNAQECIYFVLTLRGKSRGQPPKIAEKRCAGFPSEEDIRGYVASHDGIDRKLKARNAINENGIWHCECSFEYRKSDADSKIYALSLLIDVSLDGPGNTAEAIVFIKEARAIAEGREREVRELLEQERAVHAREIAAQRSFYEGTIKELRGQHKESLDAERALSDRRLLMGERFVTEMQKTLTAAVEAKTGQSAGDKQLAELQGKLVNIYEGALKDVQQHGSTPTSIEFIKTVESSIGLVSALAGAGKQVKALLGTTEVAAAPLPGQPPTPAIPVAGK